MLYVYIYIYIWLPLGCLSVAGTWLWKLFAGFRDLFAPKLFRTVLTWQHSGTPTPEPVPKPFRIIPNRSNLQSQILEKSRTKDIETVPEHDERVLETIIYIYTFMYIQLLAFCAAALLPHYAHSETDPKTEI